MLDGSSLPPDRPVVLLVDDQAIFGGMVRHMLAAERDIEFHYCSRADEAIPLAANVRPSVILQDLVMPGADGLDLILGYRSQAETRLTPLIVLSSDEEPTTKAEAFRRGANDYLVKFPDRVELVARIRYHARTYHLLLKAEALHEAEKRRLVEQRRAGELRARNTLIFALAKLAESRDSDTGEHLERIEAYCRVLAEELRATRRDLTDEWIRNLQLASSLHDIGKVGIPDGVLLKAGRLTPEERAVIEKHPTIGAEALDAILNRARGDDLLLMARNIAAAHHERWDGRGYPAGLRGGDIPLEARIVAVADVYDALTSRRVYKPPMPHEEAMRIICDASGTQFDPEIVAALRRSEVVFRQAGLLLHAEEDPAASARVEHSRDGSAA